jgi:hypothetical protein
MVHLRQRKRIMLIQLQKMRWLSHYKNCINAWSNLHFGGFKGAFVESR